jgi:chemotaxis signal transduction protein
VNPSGRSVDDLGYWAGAMQRLSRAAESTNIAMQPAGSRADEIFAERARSLAAPIEDSRGEAHLDLIAFEIGSQKVAIESRYIRAVIPVAEPAPVPGVSDVLAGVINFRGVILPVFRLERILGAGETVRSATIVLGEGKPEFAIFANAVEDVADLSAHELLNVSWQGHGDAPAALGLSENALNVLDGRALLSDPRFYVGRTAARI